MRRYAFSALLYSLLGLGFGVFYREFTRGIGYEGATTLSVVHVHYLAMGMLFFLIVLAMEKLFGFTGSKASRWFFPVYSVGLNLTVAMLVVRGVAQALEANLSSGADASISGMAGLGHAALAVGLVLFLIALIRVLPKDPKASPGGK